MIPLYYIIEKLQYHYLDVIRLNIFFIKKDGENSPSFSLGFRRPVADPPPRTLGSVRPSEGVAVLAVEVGEELGTAEHVRAAGGVDGDSSFRHSKILQGGRPSVASVPHCHHDTTGRQICQYPCFRRGPSKCVTKGLHGERLKTVISCNWLLPFCNLFAIKKQGERIPLFFNSQTLHNS